MGFRSLRQEVIDFAWAPEVDIRRISRKRLKAFY